MEESCVAPVVVDQADGNPDYVGERPGCCVALFPALVQPN